ncbi:MAG: hypothetical protein J5883_02195 [Clostridiales bacterium]|nr:hypothetical protein [Clostridiales bacterium]
MEDMSFGKKLLFSLVTALTAVIVYGITLCILVKEFHTILLVLLIAAVVLGAFLLVLLIALDSKSKKIKAGVIAGLSVLGVLIIFSSVIMVIAPMMLFPKNHDEDAYDEMVELAAAKDNTVEQISCGDLTGWRICARNLREDDKRPVILFFAGNGMNSSRTAELFMFDEPELYAPLCSDYDFVYFDYPGYGTSAGEPTGDSLRQMALDVFDEVDSWSTTSSIICFGYSIGTGPATYCASQKDADGLVLWAPYANSYDVYNNVMDVFHGPMKLLVLYKMNSEKYIKDVECPILIMASDTDEVIPYESSRALFASAGGSSDFMTISGIGHNDFWVNDKVIESTAEFAGEVS